MQFYRRQFYRRRCKANFNSSCIYFGVRRCFVQQAGQEFDNHLACVQVHSLDDISDGIQTFTIAGLAAGDYEIYVYAWAPDVPGAAITNVAVNGGANVATGQSAAAPPPYLNTGVERHLIGGVTVKVTDVPRTVADCFKYRNLVGLDVALEALRDCWRQRRATMDQLHEAAVSRRMANVMRPYLESLT